MGLKTYVTDTHTPLYYVSHPVNISQQIPWQMGRISSSSFGNRSLPYAKGRIWQVVENIMFNPNKYKIPEMMIRQLLPSER